MFRVGILGAENSHAMAFGQIFNGIREDLKGEFDDIQVTAVSGHYPEANREVYEKCGLEILADSPEELEGKVDAIMVTARDGRYMPALPVRSLKRVFLRLWISHSPVIPRKRWRWQDWPRKREFRWWAVRR